MAIQNRRGAYNNFTPSKMVPGEFAVVQSGDPNAANGQAVYVAFQSGQAKRLATNEDIQTEIASATQEVAAEISQRVEDAVADDVQAAQTAASNASTSAQTATQKANAAAASATQAEQTVANIIDNTLTQTGKAADAKKVGDEITSLKGDLVLLNDHAKSIEDVLPNDSVTTDITSSIQWTDGKYINIITENIDNYADAAYGIVGSVQAGDRFHVDKARGMGNWRAITIISADGIVNNHCTILSYAPTAAGYYEDDYIVPVSGIMVVGANLNHQPVAVTKTDVNLIDAASVLSVNNTNTRIDELISQLPKKYVKTDITDSIQWTTGKFIRITDQSVVDYADAAYGIIGAVKAGDTFDISNARGVGGWRAITLISNIGIVDNKCEILSYYPTDAGYFNGEYTVPQDGILVLGSNANYSSVQAFKMIETISFETSPLAGCKWYSIGDSLNEFNSTADTNWIKYMIAATDADNTNVAKSGSGFYRGTTLEGYQQINYIKQLESVESDAELITIAGSFNDLMPSPWSPLPVGSASDTGSDTIAGYMNTFFNALIAAYPNCAIAVIMTSPWDVFKPGNTASDNYVSVLKAICEKHGIPFYPDCYYGCNLRPWNASNKETYYTHADGSVDGVHPNSKGHIFLYRMLRPFLEKCVHVST